MHEMSLCEGVLQVLETEAKAQGFSKVISVWLEIGDLSSVEPEALLFSFDVVTRNSLADGAELKIINVPGHAPLSTLAEGTGAGGNPSTHEGREEAKARNLSRHSRSPGLHPNP